MTFARDKVANIKVDEEQETLGKLFSKRKHIGKIQCAGEHHERNHG